MATPSDLIPRSPGEKPVAPPSRLPDFGPASAWWRTPQDPVHTANQRRMLLALESDCAGHFELAMEVYAMAEEACNKGNSHVAWSWLNEDRRQRRYSVVMQLFSLPKILLRSLIRNTLPYDYVHNGEVQAAANTYMSITNLPGVYCQALAIKRTVIGGVSKEDVGKGWSRDQVEQLCADIELYLEDSPRGDQFGVRVDKHISSNNKKDQAIAEDPKSRRYCHSSRREDQRNTLVRWKDLLRNQQSFDNTSRLDGAEHSIRARMEVGWSIDQEARLKEHQHNAKTTHLWGLGQALSRLNWPRQYAAPYQWCLFRVWDRDVQLAKLSEHLGSVLCSAYAWEGGFNCTEAGSITFKDGFKAAPDAPGWLSNANEIFVRRACMKRNFEKNLQELKEQNQALGELPAKRRKEEETKKLRAAEIEELKEYWELRAFTERMKEELAEVKLQITKSQEPDPAAERRRAALARAREHLAKVKKANAITVPSESSSSRVPETPSEDDIRTTGVSHVTANSALRVEEPPLVDNDNDALE